MQTIRKQVKNNQGHVGYKWQTKGKQLEVTGEQVGNNTKPIDKTKIMQLNAGTAQKRGRRVGNQANSKGETLSWPRRTERQKEASGTQVGRKCETSGRQVGDREKSWMKS